MTYEVFRTHGGYGSVLYACQSECAPEAHPCKRVSDAAVKRTSAEDRSRRLQARRKDLSPGVETSETAETAERMHASNPRVWPSHSGDGCSLRPASTRAASWLPLGVCTGYWPGYKDGGDETTDFIGLRLSSPPTSSPASVSSGSAPCTPHRDVSRHLRRTRCCQSLPW